MLRESLKSVLQDCHLLGPVRRLRRRIKHPFKLSNQAIVAQYFSQVDLKKLNIGCGTYVLAGWLNTDISPASPTIMYLDASQRFPFKQETFDYIFSEHVIEHITYSGGVTMLSECFRVLKKSGKIRISTPDLAFLVDLTRADKTPLQRAYIKWAVDTFTPGLPNDNEVFAINNFVRNWGHTFIYNEKTLRDVMAAAGFNRITKCEQHQSDDAALRNLENEAHLPPNFLRLETLTLEGIK